ncbi:MAG: hypothetical protein HY457_00560 [Parcubacteria group bacterium]|nr:hypothetical protein [Parcubacteria group bacterium]
MYPTGILKNTATNRFHPISFRLAPMPGNADERAQAQRYKSVGHHAEGFDTLEAAQQWISEQKEKGLVDVGVVWEWDGDGTPAMVEWFSKEQLTVSTESVGDAGSVAPIAVLAAAGERE